MLIGHLNQLNSSDLLHLGNELFYFGCVIVSLQISVSCRAFITSKSLLFMWEMKYMMLVLDCKRAS